MLHFRLLVVLCVVLVGVCQSRALAENALSVDLASLKAVATFESVGVYVDFSGDDNRNAVGRLQYRARGEADWREGHELFADHRLNAFWGINTRQFRGSLVHLAPGTDYEIRLVYSDPDGVQLLGQPPAGQGFVVGDANHDGQVDRADLRAVEAHFGDTGEADGSLPGDANGDGRVDGRDYIAVEQHFGNAAPHLRVTTWSEQFPPGVVETVNDRDTTLVIDRSGAPGAYRVYQPAPGGSAAIDVADQQSHCVTIDADYVIVRGLTLKGASEHAITIASGRHDIIIEDCEITQWGHHNINTAPTHCAIHADKGTERLIIQHNIIHNPHGGSLDWSHGHPLGPAGIEINQSRGNHVIRYNAFYAEPAHWFKDILGGSDDGGSGSLRQDSDVYGNLMGNCWDDVLEVEGFDMNIRIWGNVIKDGFKGIATANIGYNRSHGVDSSLGPIYVFRNLLMDLSSTANKIRGDGGYYFYHNTVLASVADGGEWPSRARSPEIASFGVVKNNIIESAPKAFRYELVESASGGKWFLDHNLYTVPRAGLTLRPGWEQHGIMGATPQYQPDGYDLPLKPGSPGVDGGQVIPNFSDRFSGSAPDIGASEPDAWSIRVGPHGDSRPQ